MNFDFRYFLTLIFVLTIIPFAQAIIYVDANNPNCGTADGNSWASAYCDLQEALSRPGYLEEIWIKEGTYYPVTCNPCSEIERGLSFEMPYKPQIFGGFPQNLPNPTMNDRNPTSFLTILSGDIGTLDDFSDNSYHVLFIEDNYEQNSRLDGLIIEKGNANGDTEVSWHSKRGGGIFFASFNDDFSYVSFYGGPILLGMKFKNCIIRDCHADENGGGAYIRSVFDQYGQPIFEGCKILNNSCDNWGGGLHLDAYSGNSNASFINCEISNNTALYGAAMGMDGREEGNCAPQITGCSFNNNTASVEGGAIYALNYDLGKVVFNLCNSTFTENEAISSRGGAITSEGNGTETGIITDCEFTNNGSPTTTQNGGAILFNSGNNVLHDVLIKNSKFTGNQASNSGGAITYFISNSHANIKITDCHFWKNAAPFDGAISINDFDNGFTGSIDINNSHFVENKAVRANDFGGDAGVMSLTIAQVDIHITDCSFVRNEAGFSGGALVIRDSSPKVKNCNFIKNTAIVEGGAIRNLARNSDVSNPEFIQCVFLENTSQNSGGAIVNNNANPATCAPMIRNCTFLDNEAPAGRAIQNYDTDLSIYNSIVWDIFDFSGIINSSNSTITSEYNNIQIAFGTSPSGPGNISSDPQFYTLNNSNYQLTLSANSPCVDAGLDAYLTNTSTDIAGNPRFVDGDALNTSEVDMGAHEYAASLNLNYDAKNVTCDDHTNGVLSFFWDTNEVDFMGCSELKFHITGPNGQETVTQTFNNGIFRYSQFTNKYVPSGCYLIQVEDCVGDLTGAFFVVEVADHDADGTPDCQDVDCLLPTITMQGIDPSTCPASDGSITVLPSGSVSDYQYTQFGRSSYSSSNVFDNKSGGTYKNLHLRNNTTFCEMKLPTVVLTVNDCTYEWFGNCNNGIDDDGDNDLDCLDSQCAPIINISSVQSPSCPDDSNGEIAVTVNGNTGGQLMMSTDGGKTYRGTDSGFGSLFTFSNLSAGIHQFKSLDETNGCTYSASFVLACTEALAQTAIDFLGEIKAEENYLYWAIPSENDIEKVELQRSLDGRDNWNSIYQMNWNNQSGLYQFIDNQINETAYYQLKLIKSSGIVTYSNLITLERVAKEDINIFPNPAQDYIQLTGEMLNNSDVEVFIYDALGKLHWQQLYLPNQNISVENWAAGSYWIKVKTKNNVHTQIVQVK